MAWWSSAKKIEKDAADSLDSEYIKTAINDSKQIDYLLVSFGMGSGMVKKMFLV